MRRRLDRSPLDFQISNRNCMIQAERSRQPARFGRKRVFGPLSPMPNALAQEKSPYLLQHADNPVAWLPWGEAAFARARAEQ